MSRVVGHTLKKTVVSTFKTYYIIICIVYYNTCYTL